MNYTLILEGIVLGLGLAILVGPLFFILLEASISRGSKNALQIAAGIWLSDIIIAGLSFLFVERLRDLINMDGFQSYVGGLGGIILILLGLGSFFAKTKKNAEEPTSKSAARKGVFMNILKGFIVNTANPFTFFFWISVTTSYAIGKKASMPEILLVLGTIIVVIVISDLTKIHFARYLRKFIKTDYDKIGKIIGLALCIFGVILIVRTYAF